jgi:RNA polymerase sigma factor (TIGR02999 family)
MPVDEGEVTLLLRQWQGGDKRALDQLMPLIYPRLRAMAGGLERNERAASTLQATGLVHEAYLRLLQQKSLGWEDREHFFSFAAHVMRLILTDHARSRLAQKRGGAAVRVPLHDSMQWVSIEGEEMVDLNRALEELEKLDARKVRIVELRYILGCTAEETADLLQLSKATVDRDLQVARAWLFRQLKGNSENLSSG